jgi:hypothetical protein
MGDDSGIRRITGPGFHPERSGQYLIGVGALSCDWLGSVSRAGGTEQRLRPVRQPNLAATGEMRDARPRQAAEGHDRIVRHT